MEKDSKKDLYNYLQNTFKLKRLGLLKESHYVNAKVDSEDLPGITIIALLKSMSEDYEVRMFIEDYSISHGVTRLSIRPSMAINQELMCQDLEAISQAVDTIKISEIFKCVEIGLETKNVV